MSSLIGPGHISDFLGRSEREFEKSKRGCPTPWACQQAEQRPQADRTEKHRPGALALGWASDEAGGGHAR
jgi:hypothetical protein